MRLHIVMEKTVQELMSLKRTVGILIGGLVPVAIFALLRLRGIFGVGNLSLEMQTHYLLGYFIILSFAIITGYIGYLVVAGTGQELVSKEEKRGTLLLMVSKPISRFQFLLGKYLGLVFTSLLYVLTILLGSILIFWGILGLDPDIVAAALCLVPWIFLLSILVVPLFASISLVLSTLVKSDRIRGTFLMLIIMLVLGAGSSVRMLWPDVYENYHIYCLDGTYNLGNSYLLLLNQANNTRMIPQTQALLGMATGTYKAEPMTALAMLSGASEIASTTLLDPDIGSMPPSLEKTAYLNPLISIALCLLAAGATFGIANVTLDRKEVQ